MADWLSNRRAIVTGAARGIGLAVAQSLALLGARVLMVDNGCAVDGAAEDPAVTELADGRDVRIRRRRSGGFGLLVVLLGLRAAVLPPLDDHRHHGEDDDADDDQLEMLLHDRDLTEEPA